MSRGMKSEPAGLHSERLELLSEACVLSHWLMGWVTYWLVDALDPAGPKPKLAMLFAEELI